MAMSFNLRYAGVLDFHEFTRHICEWFEKKGFEYYITMQKSTPQDFGNKEEQTIKGWYNETEYHRIYVTVKLTLWDATPVEITENGETKEKTKGRLLVVGKGDMETDFEGHFNKTTFSKKLKQFMENYVLNQRYDAMWGDDLHYRVQGLGEHIKSYLNYNSQGKYF